MQRDDPAYLRIRGLVESRRIIEETLRAAVREACDAGADRMHLAHILGVHRATFYRQYLPPASTG